MSQKKLKFIHVGDVHLGKYDRGLDVRFHDNSNALKQVIKYAIDNKVDCVLCSGDFFETYRPTPDAMMHAIVLLNRLKNANIPFILTEGNHDMRRGTHLNSVLNILEAAGVAKHVRVVPTDKGDILEHTDVNGIKIYGLGYIRGANNKAALEKYASMIDGKENIILIHIGITGSDQKSKDVDSINGQTLANVFKDKYIYIGLGHYHSSKELLDLNIVQAGATERWKIDDSPEKNFYYCEYENGKLNITKEKINTRPWLVFKHKYDDFDQAMRDLRNWVDQNKDKKDTFPGRSKYSQFPIYYIHITGEVKTQYDRSIFENIVEPIQEIYSKTCDLLVSKYTRKVVTADYFDEELIKKEILKEHFSIEFGDNADPFVDLTLGVEQLGDKLTISSKEEENMELLGKKFKPIIELYDKFIEDNPDLLIFSTSNTSIPGNESTVNSNTEQDSSSESSRNKKSTNATKKTTTTTKKTTRKSSSKKQTNLVDLGESIKAKEEDQ